MCHLQDKQRGLMNNRRLSKLVEAHNAAFEFPVSLKVLKRPAPPRSSYGGDASLTVGSSSESMSEISSEDVSSDELRNEELMQFGIRADDSDYEMFSSVLFDGGLF